MSAQEDESERRGLRDALEQLGRIVVSDDTLESVLDAVTASAKAVLPPSVEVSVSLLRDDHREGGPASHQGEAVADARA